MSDSDSDLDFAAAMKKCNYCGAYAKLVPNKPYCQPCQKNCWRECKR